jgi:hypothetical protein
LPEPGSTYKKLVYNEEVINSIKVVFIVEEQVTGLVASEFHLDFGKGRIV